MIITMKTHVQYYMTLCKTDSDNSIFLRPLNDCFVLETGNTASGTVGGNPSSWYVNLFGLY